MSRALAALLLVLLTPLASGDEEVGPERRDRLVLGVAGGVLFPTDSAYDTAAPELGLVVGYSPEWQHVRVDLSAFATAGRAAERGVSVLVSWLPTAERDGFFAGGGLGVAWLGINYALANEVGWHAVSFPEEHGHAPFIAVTAGWELDRTRARSWAVSLEIHFPFDYLAFDSRFPSLLVIGRLEL